MKNRQTAKIKLKSPPNKLCIWYNMVDIHRGLHGMRNMTFYNTKYVIHGYGRHARHLWSQITMAGGMVFFLFPLDCVLLLVSYEK